MKPDQRFHLVSEDAKGEEKFAVVEIFIFGVLCCASEAGHSRGRGVARVAAPRRLGEGGGGAPLGLRISRIHFFHIIHDSLKDIITTKKANVV